MAYVPPHRRCSEASGRPMSTLDLLVPRWTTNANLRTLRPPSVRRGMIVYADGAISRWFAVGLDDDGSSVPLPVRLQPVSMESFEKRTGVKPFVTVKSNSERENSTMKTEPWISIADNLVTDLLSSSRIVRDEMRSHSMEELKPTLVARFGKILFRRGLSTSCDNVTDSTITDTTVRDWKRTFYTSVPDHYVENIVSKILPKIGFGFKQEKDIYHVKLFDSKRPDATISCKCRANEDNKLELYKVELNQVRNMVADISCLSKDLDLRVMLCTRRILSSLTDDEINGIRNLIDAAVIDPSVKGGLKWPVADGDGPHWSRYNVVGVWHLVSTAYRSTFMKLKVRCADRHDLVSGIGETSKEVVMKLKEILSGLQEDNVVAASDLLKDTLGVIWGDFLQCEPSLVGA